VTTVLGIIAAVLAVSLLIMLHEGGHYLAARAFGMRVPRFSVGFGKVLLSFRRAGTEWAISALPLGGYVRIEGMAPGEDVDAKDPAVYSNQAAWRRFLTIFAGPAVNYLVAALLAAALLATVGLREVQPGALVGKPTPGMPAAQAGLQDGDQLLTVAGAPVATWEDMVAALQGHPGETITLEVERGGARRALQITPRDAGGKGVVGFAQHYGLVTAPAGEALSQGFGRTTTAVWDQLSAFKRVFTRSKGGGSISGPLGIVGGLLEAIREGAPAFLSFIWTLSVALAVLNLIPFPGLDGGRLVFLAYELVTRRKVNERVEAWVHVVGLAAIVLLVLGVTVFGDLPRLFHR
jgi:regulator of sigma E protease